MVVLEINPGEGGLELELEDNPGEIASADDVAVFPELEDNEAVPSGEEEGCAIEQGEEEEEWEIPFALEGADATEVSQTIEVRLARKGDERLGLVLDAMNVIVALRDSTAAAASGELFVGDTVLAVQGVECTADRRVALLLRELPDAATYVFTVRRALDATAPDLGGAISEPVAEHGAPEAKA